MRLPSLLALLLSSLAVPPPAGARTLLARYEVQAGGLTVLRMEVAFDLDGPRYQVRTRARTAGLAGFLASSDQTTSAEGTWRGAEPVPDRYRVEGSWRGGRRRVEIDYAPAGMPLLRAIEPPHEADREAVPAALLRNTMDTLSALAKLTRTVAMTGRCDAAAAVYDGRRRVDYTVRTEGREMLPLEGGFAGEALRCDVESRLVAGLRASQDPEQARQPQPATAWLARVAPAHQPLPVRIEVPSRWFGTIRVVLLGVEAGAPLPPASGQDVAQQRR